VAWRVVPGLTPPGLTIPPNSGPKPSWYTLSCRPLLQGHGVLAQVILDLPRGPRPDIVERLGIFHAVFPPQLPVARQDELLDVIPIGRRVVVSQERQPSV